jgi:hypothetical protein
MFNNDTKYGEKITGSIYEIICESMICGIEI